MYSTCCTPRQRVVQSMRNGAKETKVTQAYRLGISCINRKKKPRSTRVRFYVTVKYKMSVCRALFVEQGGHFHLQINVCLCIYCVKVELFLFFQNVTHKYIDCTLYAATKCLNYRQLYIKASNINLTIGVKPQKMKYSITPSDELQCEARAATHCDVIIY